jgi:hypothetical protein
MPQPNNSASSHAICQTYQQVRHDIMLFYDANLAIVYLAPSINPRPGALQQKIRLSGIIIVMYSPQQGPPARMYMLVADKDGVAGVTVWGDTVNQLLSEPDVIGRSITIPGCTISCYQGKRSLNVPRNHVIQLTDTSPHADWWEGKLQAESVTTKHMQSLQDNTICNIFAVCAGMRREERTQCKIANTLPYTMS